MRKNMVIGFYGHPEYYPPTLNAIQLLSEKYESIDIVHRNYPSFNWQYPSNVQLFANAKERPISTMERASVFNKIWLLLRFTKVLFHHVKRSKPDTILLYDSAAVLAYALIKPFIKKPRVLWYHNHDVMDLSAVKKYSIGGMSWKAEKKLFPLFDIFSLPAIERKNYFPMDKLKGSFYFLPNYPSLKIYGAYKKKELRDTVRILYQGSISPMHGLEEIIEILPGKINGLSFELVLKGFIHPGYLAELYKLAEKNCVKERLVYIAPGGYEGVIENAARCHIGIGIHKKEDIMNNTLGTASNKIYEYAASGMPVILYNNAHFKEHLNQAEWAFFTDCSTESLTEILKSITRNYDYYSTKARHGFEEKFNFEYYFSTLIQKLDAVS